MALNRDTETRASKARKTAWKPPSLLPDPDKQAGVQFRWIRVGSRGQIDNKNVSARFREGWVPVNAKDHPELNIVSDRGAHFPEGVEVGGLLLCKTSMEAVEARNDYFANMAHGQMQAVDNSFLRENDPRMPLLKPERRTRTTFGGTATED